MYRYSVDNAVTYTPDDFVLFRESPFAAWMERLTLENPDHGIPPDIHSVEPSHSPDSEIVYSEIVDTLRAEARDVALISADLDEPSRRAATLAAMRDGADFIVNGLLALGSLCGTANLLMRTSGYSDLGDYLYVPCDTQAQTTLHSAFRLCFLADLLHSLQGQLPPQMLIIRGDADVVPLHTDDHIYYYRAVKKRFMADMASFRKHRMPDPTESSHFGRWAECASEVLKQRALSEKAESEDAFDDTAEEMAVPELQVAGMVASAAPAYEMSEAQQPVFAQNTVPRAELHGIRVQQTAAMASHTLAEQARTLDPGSYRAGVAPGPTPNLARFAKKRPAAVVSKIDPVPVSEKLELDLVALEPLEESLEEESLELDLVALDSTQTTGPEPTSPELGLVELEPLAAQNASVESELVELGLLLDDDRLAPAGQESSVAGPQPDCHGVDVALQNLEFIGSSTGVPPGKENVPELTADETLVQAPPPTLRDVHYFERPLDENKRVADTTLHGGTGQLPELEPPEPLLLPPDEVLIADGPQRAAKPHPLDSDGYTVGSTSVVDMDGAPPPTLAPVVENLLTERNASETTVRLKQARRKSDAMRSGSDSDDVPSSTRVFSSSLITSEDTENY